MNRLIAILLCMGVSGVYAADFHKVDIPASAKSYPLSKENLPTGAKDFSVELPKPQNNVVLNAADFGLNESVENAATILNRAIKRCRELGASKLVVNKGVYKIFEEVAVDFSGLKDFTFDGNGATFVFRKKTTNNFNFTNCERVKFENFNVDWDWDNDPLASLVEVVGKNVDKCETTYVDLKFVDYPDGFNHPKTHMVCVSPYDVKADCVGSDFGTHTWFNNPRGKQVKERIEWLKPNVARIYAPAPKSIRWGGWKKFATFEMGMMLRLQHYYYHMNNMVFVDNVNLTMENVNVYSCAGHCFYFPSSKKQKYLQFIKTNIKRPENSRIHRVITCTADHFHMKGMAGFVKIIDCEFGLGADDCVNVHSNSRHAKRNSDFSVVSDSVFADIGDRIEFRNPDFSPAGLVAKVAKVVKLKPKGTEFFFDEKIPQAADKTGVFILFNREYNTHNLIIKNCKFWGNRARGVIFQASDITMENCVLYHNEANAMKINSGYNPGLWTEGHGAKNIVVRNCVFEAANSTPNNVDGDNVSAITMAIYKFRTQYPALTDILFENNRFIDTFGRTLDLASCKNVIFYKNTFEQKTPRKNELPTRSTIKIEKASDVKIIDNVFFESGIAKPAVYVDKDTTSGIVIEGNRLVERTWFDKIWERVF